MTRRDPSALGGLSILGHLNDLRVHIMNGRKGQSGITGSLVYGAVFCQIALTDTFNAVVLTPGHPKGAVVPVGPEIYILSVPPGGVIIEILCHQIPAVLRRLNSSKAQLQFFPVSHFATSANLHPS